MKRAALYSLCICTLLVRPSFAQNPPSTPEQAAVEESIRRQAYKIELERKLADAQIAEKRGEDDAAARLYDDSLALIKKIGPGMDAEYRQGLIGMTTVRLRLAERAQRNSDFPTADAHVARILREDPRNPAALAFRENNAKLRAENLGKMPSEEALRQLPAAADDKIAANTLVQNGKVLYEAGKLDAAEKQLQQAVRVDPGNKAAYYYLDLLRDQRFRDQSSARENWSKGMMLDVARAWNEPIKRE